LNAVDVNILAESNLNLPSSLHPHPQPCNDAQGYVQVGMLVEGKEEMEVEGQVEIDTHNHPTIRLLAIVSSKPITSHQRRTWLGNGY